MKNRRITAMLLLILLISVVLPPVSLAYSTGDDYPSKYKDYAKDSIVDEWNFYNRECTSFAAWCLNSRNGVAFTNQYGGVSRWGNADSWGSVARGLGIDVNSTPAVGAIAWWSSGHVAWVKAVDGNSVDIEEYNYDYNGRYNERSISASSVSGFIHIKDINPDPDPMSEGYDRVLPDGDYIIAAYNNPLYILDIVGGEKPASNNTDVQLLKVNSLDSIGDVDVWTISYNSSDRFYTIKQKGTDMCLDVCGNGIGKGKEIQAYSSSGNPLTHKWAISRSDDRGYQLQAQCSGLYLDMEHGVSDGMNIQQWTYSTSTNDQQWLFIPYKPAQPISEGRYMLVSTVDASFIVDVEGDTGEVENKTNVRLWSETANNQYNSFDVIPLSNGYYKIVHSASGKVLEVTGGSAAHRANIALYDDNGSAAQQWAIRKNGSGYTLWARCSGKVIDQVGWDAENGVNVFQYFFYGNECQTWSFAKAEHRVRYDFAGGVNGPAEQTKYYRNDLQISKTIPSKDGYIFKCWEDITSASGITYMPGDIYRADSNMMLCAIWEKEPETDPTDPPMIPEGLTVETAAPTAKPTAAPTAAPTAKPTEAPTAKPTAVPTAKPTAAPTAKPTTVPTAKPTTAPTAAPVSEPTVNPGKSEEMSEEERAAKALADKTAAAEVLAQISTLPQSAGAADKAAVEAARAAYDALTDDQKALVSIDALSTLMTAEKQVEKAENATPVPTATPKPAKEKLSKAKITVKAQTYTGKAIKPAVTVKLNGKTLKKGTDYTVSYKNNKAVGKATAIVKGKGKYTGTVKKAFRINPQAVKGLALKAGSKKLTVTWKKDAGVTGYEVQYALKKDFKGAKKVTVKKDKTVKTVLKSLKAGKTYYVRIRAYKTVKKVKYYSDWSKAVKAKAK